MLFRSGVDAELSALKDEKEKLKVAITEKNQETSQLREHIKSMNAGSSEELSRVNEALTDLRVSHESAIAEREALLVARADVEERLAKVEAERDSLARDVASTSEAASRVAVLEHEIADIRVDEEKPLAETTALVEEKSALILIYTVVIVVVSAIRYFGVDSDCFEEKHQRQEPWSSRKYENCFIRVDVLEKKGNLIKIHEVKAKSFSGTEGANFLKKDG